MKGGTFMFCRWFAACCVLLGMGRLLPADEPAAGQGAALTGRAQPLQPPLEPLGRLIRLRQRR